MKWRGGYDIDLSGRPAGQVRPLALPARLLLPLKTPRFDFAEIKVEDRQQVAPGHVLATDPQNFSVPLLAPYGGSVLLDQMPGHLILDGVEPAPEEPFDEQAERVHIPAAFGQIGIKRYKLVKLGAWQYVSDAHTGRPVNPFGTPSAVIVSTVHLEPFTARGDVQMHKRLPPFIRGLEQLQTLLEYQPIYLVMPDIQSAFAQEVRQTIRGYAWARLVQVPLRYPFDHPGLLARRLGLSPDPENPVWMLPTAGVLALDRALTLSRPCTVRIISLGGPAVEEPVHLKAVVGYPIHDILAGRVGDGPVRVIGGGALTGQALDGDDAPQGLDAECQGLTVLPEHSGRELLGFTRPGWDRRSYSRCFLSSLRGAFSQRLTTALRGERRPCVACGQCEEVCPAGIMPHRIHRLLYRDELEQVERSRVDLCVACGLCSYICPSKIELREQVEAAQQTIAEELHPEELHPEEAPQ